MEAEDLFLKIKFKCEKCGREFESMAITSEFRYDGLEPSGMIFKTACLSCGSECWAKTHPYVLYRRFEKLVEGLEVPMREEEKIRLKCHWYDFCIKDSEIYKEVMKRPEFADLGA